MKHAIALIFLIALAACNDPYEPPENAEEAVRFKMEIEYDSRDYSTDGNFKSYYRTTSCHPGRGEAVYYDCYVCRYTIYGSYTENGKRKPGEYVLMRYHGRMFWERDTLEWRFEHKDTEELENGYAPWSEEASEKLRPLTTPITRNFVAMPYLDRMDTLMLGGEKINRCIGQSQR